MSQLITNEYPGSPGFQSGLLYSAVPAQRCNYDSANWLAEILWRVRKWQSAISVSSPAGPLIANGTYVCGQWTSSFPGGVPDAYMPDERHLPCAFDPDFIPGIPEWDANGYAPDVFLFGQSTGDLLGCQYAETYGFDVDGSGVQSNWFIQPKININNSGGFSSLVTFDGIDNPHSVNSVSAVDFQIYGRPCNLYESAAFPYTGSIIVTPYEWWPYAPTSGGSPVFDSATGLQINPNVVID